jgi:cytochrome P450
VSAGLREWIRGADDSAYTKHIVASIEASPRNEVADLHTPIAVARAECPVQPKGQSALLGLEDFRTMSQFTERPLYSLIGYDEARTGFAEAATFSSSIHNETIGQVWGETLLGMDGDKHRRYRGLIAQAFRRKAIDSWRDDVIVPVVGGLIDRFAARGSADLVSELTMLFPVYVIAEMLGLPREDVPTFTAWAADTVAIFSDPGPALSASHALNDYLHAHVASHRASPSPSPDLIGMLIDAEMEGQRLTDQEIVNFCRILLPAGAETTYRSTSNLLYGLLHHPAQLAELAADRSLLAGAIEEGLRWEPPLTALNRISTEDTSVSGVPVPAGAVVACNIAGANRDPKRFPDPDRFDIHRDAQGHIAFAYGPHLCIGMHLARYETEVAVAALLDRCRDLRLDPDNPTPEIRGIGFRAPAAINVLFTPEGS